jgi:hypothetical protein
MVGEIGLHLGDLLGLEAGARASLAFGFSPASAARSTLALGFGLAITLPTLAFGFGLAFVVRRFAGAFPFTHAVKERPAPEPSDSPSFACFGEPGSPPVATEPPGPPVSDPVLGCLR